MAMTNTAMSMVIYLSGTSVADGPRDDRRRHHHGTVKTA
jgi:hypothetical protein